MLVEEFALLKKQADLGEANGRVFHEDLNGRQGGRKNPPSLHLSPDSTASPEAPIGDFFP